MFEKFSTTHPSNAAMLHAGFFHLFSGGGGLPFFPPVRSNPPSPPSTCQSSYPQKPATSKAASFTIDSILGLNVQQQNNFKLMQDHHNQLQYQQHLFKHTADREQEHNHHQQQQQQQQLQQQQPYHRISRPAPYPSSVTSNAVPNVTSARTNQVANVDNTSVNCSVRNSSGSTGGKVSKTKRIRTIFTAEQLDRLESEFARQQYMVGPERVYLASTLQLSEAQVKVWFQNRRIKWRKQFMESQHARFQDSHQKPDSPTDGTDSRSASSPLADVEEDISHETSDDDRIGMQNNVIRQMSEAGAPSSPTHRAASVSPTDPSQHVSRSPSPSSSSSSGSSTSPPPRSPEDNRTIGNCSSEAVSKSIDHHNRSNISYNSSIPASLSEYLTLNQFNNSMLVVKDHLAKAHRNLH